MISAEIFFFCCENSGVRGGKTPTGGPRPTSSIKKEKNSRVDPVGVTITNNWR